MIRYAERSPRYDVKVIEAGGGLIWRTQHGALEVLLIHRPGRDWSLPKGKLDPGESTAACALREVAEETGFRCALGPELPSTTYADRRGRPKRVRYWAMTIESGEFLANHEADECRWLTIDAALDFATQPRDAKVIAALRATLAGI